MYDEIKILNVYVHLAKSVTEHRDPELGKLNEKTE